MTFDRLIGIPKRTYYRLRADLDYRRLPGKIGLLAYRHFGEDCWIIGKGQSLSRLREDHIGPGPVITLNQAIIKIESLSLPNKIYSMQKDGGTRRVFPSPRLIPICKARGYCQYIPCDGVVEPRHTTTLLLHKLESLYCFPYHQPRYVFSMKDIGLTENQFSMVCAIKIARLMGCMHLNLVSFDSCTTGDCGEYIHGKGLIRENPGYMLQAERVAPFLKGISHTWITP